MYFEDDDRSIDEKLNCTVTEMLHGIEEKNIRALKNEYIKDEFGEAFVCTPEERAESFAKTGQYLSDTEIKKQVGGSHYQLPIQPIDFIVKNGLGYREGNVIKYITRHQNKNGKQDIEKAIHYLEMILEDYND